MGSKPQKEASINCEAYAWFERNKPTFLNYSKDKVISLIQEYNLNLKSVLEIRCSARYRLNGLIRTFENCSAFGIEPSKESIEYGKEHFPGVNFSQGTYYDKYSISLLKKGS